MNKSPKAYHNSRMEIILAICTILGGFAAIWYFRDKLFRRASYNTVPTKNNIEKIVLASDSKQDWHRQNESWRTITSYKHDMNLRFEIKYTDDGVQCEDFCEPWANRHPHKSATGYWCSLYYGATLVEKFILVSVDGGRAMLPIPKPSSDGLVTSIDYKVAEIHDSIGTLQEYMKRSGLAVAAD